MSPISFYLMIGVKKAIKKYFNKSKRRMFNNKSTIIQVKKTPALGKGIDAVMQSSNIQIENTQL